MIETALIWQVVIFASIALAGRLRLWAIAFWCIWTLFQVLSYPLSLLQFGTIAISALLFRHRRHSNSDTSSEWQPPFRSLHSPPAPSPQAQSASDLLDKLNEFSKHMERTSFEIRKEAEFESQAQQRIRATGFTCEAEERVMKAALARDQALSREIQDTIGGNPLLAELYRSSLAKLTDSGPESGGTATIHSRQSRESCALKLAQHYLDWLIKLTNEGPEYRKIVYTSKESLFLHQKGRSPSDQERSEMQSILGRHIEDWVVDIQKQMHSPS